MKISRIFISVLMIFFVYLNAIAQEKEIPKLDNPMLVGYLKKNLQKSQPRLVLNSVTEKGQTKIKVRLPESK